MTSQARTIHLSIHKTLHDAFANGTAMGTAYNVYGESEMRSATTPEFPFIYLISSGTLFQIEHLPVVIVQPTLYRIALEMGGLATACDLNLHIFARDEGQALDICDAVLHLTQINLYDYTDPSSPQMDVVCELDEDADGVVWSESRHGLDDDDLALESSLRFWRTLSAKFLVTKE